MNDQQLLRYSRQILLPQVDVDGQQRLLNGCALIIGVGGLGSPVAMYLASAGVGHLMISDDDQVELSNLQRQIIHGSDDVGLDKVLSGKQTLQGLNPDIQVDAIGKRLLGDELQQAVQQANVVLDCSDNFSTRFAVNAACVATQTPLVSGATIRFEGQVSVFLPGQADSPCYNCLYPNVEELAESCSQTGVIAPMPGIVGSIQALEALKILMGIGETLSGRVLLLDGLTMEWNQMKLRKSSACPSCGEVAASMIRDIK